MAGACGVRGERAVNKRKMSLEQIIAGRDILFWAGGFKALAERIQCADGTSLSVQAGEYFYSIPRTDYGPYEAVEVGYLTSLPPESQWEKYRDPNCVVYSYVPVDLVREYVAEHGGEIIRNGQSRREYGWQGGNMKTSELLGGLDEIECPKCGSKLIETILWRESDSETAAWFCFCDMICHGCRHEASCSADSYAEAFTGALGKWGCDG